MNSITNDVVVHLNEDVDDATLDELEQSIRERQGVISVGHQPGQKHLLLVMYNAAAMQAIDILGPFRKRGLHAQLVGM